MVLLKRRHKITQEFIKAHCIQCNYCIYSDGNPWGCGEIDEYGGRSTDLRMIKVCRLKYAPIPHSPRFNDGDRLEASPNPIRILAVVKGINGYYLTQMEGGFGRFHEIPYPIKKIDLQEIDYNYELIVEDTDEPFELLVDDTEFGQ